MAPVRFNTLFLFSVAEEKAREADSKRVALEARLGEDLSKESRVRQLCYFSCFTRVDQIKIIVMEKDFLFTLSKSKFLLF